MERAKGLDVDPGAHRCSSFSFALKSAALLPGGIPTPRAVLLQVFDLFLFDRILAVDHHW